MPIKRLKYILLPLSILLLSGMLHAQEICDNGIDDDGDGFIDLNDVEDCMCTALIESSLIPNPSFEEMSCCPTANEMLQCANSWVQASEATTDYVHTCGGFLGNTSIPAFAPLPFPDGEGGVGFRDGQAMAGPNYKEYVGACLTEPMIPGVTYRLDFYVGFQDNVSGSTALDITIFGSISCFNLPFGGNNALIGCPINAGGYDELATQQVSGSNEWVNVVVEFEASEPYEVIVLGPNCTANPNWQQDPYYYVDRLALEETNEFGVPFESIAGSVCADDLVITVTNEPGEIYQWYLDGVALVGENNPSISLDSNSPEGTYMVVITANGSCTYSKEYDLLIPPYYAPIDVAICEGESYIIGVDTFDMSGYFETTIFAADGCDSIVQLTLDVSPNTFSFLQDTFCEGTTYPFFDLELTSPGEYEYKLSSAAGCDSVITLDLVKVPMSSGVDFNSPIDLVLGETVDIVPNYYDPNLIQFNWFDNNFIPFSESLVLEDFQTFQSTTIYLESVDAFGCNALDSIEIRVDNSTIKLYIPNAFSPDENGRNDRFRYYETTALASVEVFAIFDRWGGLVYQETKINGGSTFLGWDGKVNGEDAAAGEYAYYIEALFLDGTRTVFKGGVNLIR